MAKMHSLFHFVAQEGPIAPLESSLGKELSSRKVLGRTPLHDACFFSFMEPQRAKELLESGLDPNACDAMGLTPLHHLVLSTKATIEKAELLLEYGADPNLQDDSGHTPLDYARGVESSSLVPLFLGRGAEVEGLEADEINQLDQEGLSLFHWACLMGEVSVVQELRERGGDLAIKDGEGQTALHLAVGSRRGDLVGFLLEEGMEPGEPDVRGRTPLHRAVATGEIALVDQLLLSKKANVDQQDERGWGCLHYAVDQGSREMVEFLLSRWAEPSLQNDLGQTALGMAAEAGNLELVALLRTRKGSGEVAFSQKSLRGAVLEAFEERDELKLKELVDLVELVPKEFGKKSLYGKEVLCEKILRMELDFRERGCMGDSPLHLAVASQDHYLIRNLVYLGAELDHQNRSGQTALHLVAKRKVDHAEIARFLLELGANPNLQDKDGNTPSHLSNMPGGAREKKVFEILLDFEVDLNLENHKGLISRDCSHTAFSWLSAASSTKEESVRALETWRKMYRAGLDPDRPPPYRPVMYRLFGGGAPGLREIHSACLLGGLDFLELSFCSIEVLVEAGADLNLQDDKGQTPLHYLVRRLEHESSLEKMQYLLDHGADPRIRDYEGYAPLDRFVKATYPEHANLLREWSLKRR